MLNPVRHLLPAERRRLVDLRHQAECAEHHAEELEGEERAAVLRYALQCRAKYAAGLGRTSNLLGDF